MTGLSVNSVGKSFGGRAVLHGNDLEVGSNEIVALLGPSGCGKTSLLRLIAGFERVDAGEIAIDRRVVASCELHVPPERRHIGYVPQEGALFPHLTVRQNILFGLPRENRRVSAVADLVDITRLGDLLDRYPHQLSGGQQQRVALARALAPRPALVMLDEPFNALDLDLRRRVAGEIVATLRAARASALLVTHDPQEAFAAADTLAVMVDGCIAQQGAPEQVYREPISVAVAAATGPVVIVEGISEGETLATPLGTLPLHAPLPLGTAKATLRPEQLRLSRTGSGVEVKIIARRFLGAYLQLTVLAADGSRLNLAVDVGTDWQRGDTAHLAIDGAVSAAAPEAADQDDAGETIPIAAGRGSGT
jgi:iron(III) transport system ATP-binding protein